MVAVKFTTIPCELNTAHWAQSKSYFGNMCSRTNDVYARFEVMYPSISVSFKSVVKVFML